MASETTTTTKRDVTVIEPRDAQLRKRLGFDRRGIRREFAAVESLDLTDKYVQQEQRTLIDPDSVDRPNGPGGQGETAGSGIELYTEEGDAWRTYRFAQGFTMLEEDLRGGQDSVAQQRDEVIEMFDFFSDELFLRGVDDEQGNELKKGMIDWLKTNIPSARTFDCDDYDGDSGDTDDYTDNPTDLIHTEALSNVSGNLLDDDNASWDMMVGRLNAVSQFNQHDTDHPDKNTYWEQLSGGSAARGSGAPLGGVKQWNVMPDQLEYPHTPDDKSPLTVDLSTSDGTTTNEKLGPNEVILLPDMERVSNRYWKLYEMDQPFAFDPHQMGGGKWRQDYATRYTHEFDPKGIKRFSNAEDAVHIKNVDVLFN